MAPKIILIPFMKPCGMALFPFILIKSKSLEKDKILIFHEQIHIQQQKELLVLPFYFFYLVFYLQGLLRFRKHEIAYKNIPFEREAYTHEMHPDYLLSRKLWAWTSFI